MKWGRTPIDMPGDDLRPLKLSFADLVVEAGASLSARPSRVLLTALGTMLGIGSLVATLGVASSASARISSHFDALRATEVVVSDVQEHPEAPARFPADTSDRLARLNGVVAGGQLWQVATISATRFSGAPPESGIDIVVRAADVGALQAIRARYSPGGQGFNRFANRTGQRVVVLGKSAAARLGINGTDRSVAVFLDGVPFTVSGIMTDTDREAAVLLGAIVPVGTAQSLWGVAGEQRRVIVETAAGAAQLIGRQAPLVLRPEDPDSLRVVAPPDPQELRGAVESDTKTLFVLLALVSLAAGTVSIANAILISVLERVPEIGLRRAMGARRRDVAYQFLAESAAIGFVGGFAGACAGVVIVVAVTVARQWTTVVEPLLVFSGPFIGMATGMLAGIYPSLRASRVQPVAALRR